ncbi:hypothetical protein RND81_03G037600 [Saponaria officinalis]|uniref:Uncharacterized protein n=1 Tax=Saponaria officinalis TaxID=3572 RepID=A0AAW1M3C0_SAPOF
MQRVFPGCLYSSDFHLRMTRTPISTFLIPLVSSDINFGSLAENIARFRCKKNYRIKVTPWISESSIYREKWGDMGSSIEMGRVGKLYGDGEGGKFLFPKNV